MKVATAIITILTLAAAPTAATANDGDNASWQFDTTAEKANRAYIEDMRMKRVSGFYSSPTYNTSIGAQFNCNVNASASGNGGTNSAGANSPTATGPSGTATGSLATSNLNPGTAGFDAVLNNGQENSGLVYSDVIGGAGSSADGNNSYQVLNTSQSNDGMQYSQVENSSACAFANVAASR